VARKKKNAALPRAGLPGDYAAFLESLKIRVRQAQTRAMLPVKTLKERTGTKTVRATCQPLAAALLKNSSVARNCWPILAKGRPCCSSWTQAFKPAASACRCNITS